MRVAAANANQETRTTLHKCILSVFSVGRFGRSWISTIRIGSMVTERPMNFFSLSLTNGAEPIKTLVSRCMS
jgi:hypothetical protein